MILRLVIGVPVALVFLSILVAYTTTTTTPWGPAPPYRNEPPPPPLPSPPPSPPHSASPSPRKVESGNELQQVLAKVAHRGTVLATSGNWGFRAFLRNVVATLGKAMPEVRPVVALLDRRGYEWCNDELGGRAECVYHPCPCPHPSPASGNLSVEGYTKCLLGVYICKLRIKLAVVRGGYNVFFIDGDAAPKKDVLSVIPPSPHAAVGACEYCSGACRILDHHRAAVDRGAVLPSEKYWQVNIGFIWLNGSDPAVGQALQESIDIIVEHRLDFKSVDQTVFNRRLMAKKAYVHCLPADIGGLNIRGRGSRPKIFPRAWGVHAARLVSSDGFYKKALLWHNGLWWGTEANDTSFVELANKWKESPKEVKRRLAQEGRL